MSKSLKALGLAVGALALTHLPAAAQTKVTNDGISATEIVIGTHQDLSGPIKVWGVPVSNGMKMAVEEINAAGGIQGRKLRMILEDNGYDPKRAVLASQKMVERDKIFAMIGPMGSPTVLAAQDGFLEQVLDLAVEAAQLLRGPALELLMQGGVDPQQECLALLHV